MKTFVYGEWSRINPAETYTPLLSQLLPEKWKTVKIEFSKKHRVGTNWKHQETSLKTRARVCTNKHLLPLNVRGRKSRLRVLPIYKTETTHYRKETEKKKFFLGCPLLCSCGARARNTAATSDKGAPTRPIHPPEKEEGGAAAPAPSSIPWIYRGPDGRLIDGGNAQRWRPKEPPAPPSTSPLWVLLPRRKNVKRAVAFDKRNRNCVSIQIGGQSSASRIFACQLSF